MDIGGVYKTLNQKLTFFKKFYSFGVNGLKNFIIQGNKDFVQKVLFAIEKMARKTIK